MKKFDVANMLNIKPGVSIRLEFNANLKEDNTSSLEKVFLTDPSQLLEETRELKTSESDLMERVINQIQKEWNDTAYKLQQIEYAKHYQNLLQINRSMLTTHNKWAIADNYAIISNHLYAFRASLYADSNAGYKVDWSLAIRRINPEATDIDMAGLDGQHGKRFATKAEAVKYVEGRYHKYQNYFSSEFPEIPAEYANGMKFMGVLLNGYKIETQKTEN